MSRFGPAGVLARRRIADGFRRLDKRWNSDFGVSEGDWLKPGGNTPAKVFGFLLDKNVANQDELVSALTEFAYIGGCGWTRDVVHGC